METSDIAQMILTGLIGLSSFMVQNGIKGFKDSLSKLHDTVHHQSVNTAIITEKLTSIDRRLSITEDRVQNIEIKK